jgi:hypothetical protein
MARKFWSAWRKKTHRVTFRFARVLLPSDVAISIQAQTPVLDARDLSILRAIRDAIPNANELTPEAVLQFTLDAIRSYDASRLIDVPSEAETEGQNSQSTD